MRIREWICLQTILAMTLLFGAMVSGAAAGDWPQWRGPTRDGDAPDFAAPASWPKKLSLAWKREVGGGDSAPLVVGETVFVFSRQDEQETLTTLSLADGEVRWSQQETVPYVPIPIVRGHKAGPFSTPLYADGLVYTFGISGTLTARDAKTGDLIWQREFSSEFKKTRPLYGVGTSPILIDGKLITHIGGTGGGALAAFDPKTGDDLWRWSGDGPAYSSTGSIKLGGRTFVASLAQEHFIGVDVADGQLLFQQPWKVAFGAASPSPVIIDDLIVIASERHPTTAFRMVASGDGIQLEPVWDNNDVWCAMSTPVVVGDRIFAYATQQKGRLVALDSSSGEIVWKGPPRQGSHAHLITACNLVIALFNDGKMVVLDATAETYRELARYEELTESEAWAHPALIDQRLVLKDWKDVYVWEITAD